MTRPYKSSAHMQLRRSLAQVARLARLKRVHRKKDGFDGNFMEIHGVFMGFSSDLMVRDICLIGFSNGI